MQKSTHSAGGVVIGPHGKIVIVSQGGTSWSLPKGHLEADETARQAADREINEETGLTQFEYIADLGSYKRYRIGKSGDGDDHAEFKQLTFFLYRTNQTDLRPIDPVNPEARWFEPDNVAPNLTHEADKTFFMSVLNTVKTHLQYSKQA